MFVWDVFKFAAWGTWVNLDSMGQKIASNNTRKLKKSFKAVKDQSEKRIIPKVLLTLLKYI